MKVGRLTTDGRTAGRGRVVSVQFRDRDHALAYRLAASLADMLPPRILLLLQSQKATAVSDTTAPHLTTIALVGFCEDLAAGEAWAVELVERAAAGLSWHPEH